MFLYSGFFFRFFKIIGYGREGNGVMSVSAGGGWSWKAIFVPFRYFLQLDLSIGVASMD